jgi:hypothetical protein
MGILFKIEITVTVTSHPSQKSEKAKEISFQNSSDGLRLTNFGLNAEISLK